MSEQTPTARGIEKYPPDGIYDDSVPCTCRDDCPNTCDGECGCRACRAAYCDAIEWD